MSGHYEIVRADRPSDEQPWFARWKAGNSVEVWRTSETYDRERGALAAVVDHALDELRVLDPLVNFRLVEDGLLVWGRDAEESESGLIVILDVDERGA